MPVSTFGVTPAVSSVSAGTVGEASTALSSAAQVALQSLSHAMVSAEQQLQVLQEKQQQLLKLQQQVNVLHLSRLFSLSGLHTSINCSKFSQHTSTWMPDSDTICQPFDSSALSRGQPSAHPSR